MFFLCLHMKMSATLRVYFYVSAESTMLTNPATDFKCCPWFYHIFVKWGPSVLCD